jgi:alanyl-tRNA synthetase
VTVRRYYTDSYTWAFSARAVEATTAEGTPSAILDESFFYPSSGGQPHDTGRLGEARVVDVSIRDSDGAIVHRLDVPIAPGRVSATIDGSRRFDHMQQHTAQHILSQAFIRVADAPTIGFHLGAETVSIDLQTTGLGDARVVEALDAANRVVSENVPVRAWFPPAEELAGLALRKTPDVQGPIRVVAIGDFDLSACGGTHVAHAGEAGLISILRTERMKRGVRIEFLAGHRARADYARKHALLRDVAASLTCGPEEVPLAVARLTGELTEARRELAAYRGHELDIEATQLVAESRSAGNLRLVIKSWETRPVDEVKGLALRVTNVAGIVAFFGVAGARAQLLFGKSEGVALDLKPAFDRALTALGGGKGGGSRLLQGAAGAASVTELNAALEQAAAAAGGAA